LVELTDGWEGFKEFFVGGWHDSVYVVKNLFNDLSTWITKALIDGIDYGRKHFAKTLGMMLSALSTLPGVGSDFAEFKRTMDLMDRHEKAFGGNAAAEWKKSADEQRQAEEDRLAAAKRAADEARRQGREDALAAAQAAVSRLEAERDDRRAAAAAAKAGGGKAAAVAAAGGGRGGMNLPDLFGLAKGIFSGPVGMQLGYSDQTAKRQLDAATETAANSKALPSIDRKIGVVADAMKFAN
jgi:hypothetical protein